MKIGRKEIKKLATVQLYFLRKTDIFFLSGRIPEGLKDNELVKSALDL